MIDTQAIRSKILDLAMRGKLTEQLPEDGTAEELYRQILEGKQALIKAGKIKKEKPLPEITADEIPFDIPKSWKWVRFSDLYSLSNGVASRGTPGGIFRPVLRLADLASGQIDTNSIRQITLSDDEFSSHKVLTGDLVFIRVNGSRDKVANAFLYSGDTAISYCDHLFCGHRTSNSFDASYIMTVYHSAMAKAQIDPEIKTTAGQNTINQKCMGKVLIPLPPLAEQHRIVARIEQAFAALDTIDAFQEKYADNLAVLKSKLIDAAIRGKLTDQLPEDGTAEELYRQIQAEKQALIKAGKIKKEKPLPEITADEIPFEIPANWKWVQLADLCKSVMDGDHQPPPQVEEGVPFLVISNISKGVFDLSDVRHVPRDYYDSLSNERIAEKGDILFTVTGSFGIPVIVSIDGEFCFQRHMALLKPIVGGAYMHLALRSAHVHKYCDEVAIGTAQRTVGIKQLRRMPIPLPPLAEQKRIVAKLEALLPLCDESKAISRRTEP